MNAAVGEPLQHARVARARVVGSASNAPGVTSASARSMPVLGLVTVKITSSFVVSTPYSKNGQHTDLHQRSTAKVNVLTREAAVARHASFARGRTTLGAPAKDKRKGPVARGDRPVRDLRLMRRTYRGQEGNSPDSV